jgi:RNA polymerase sigma-70 factor (ECF subfamily)
LATAFLDEVGEDYPATAASADELEPFLATLLERARDKWPTVDVAPTAYAAHLARVAPADDDAVAALADLHTDDLYLACACVAGQEDAARAFEDHILPGAAKAARRVDGDPAFVQEVCSEVRVHLLVADEGEPRIASYLGRGPLMHWVQVTAMRTGQAFKRKAKRRPRASEDLADMALSILDDDPEVGPLAEQLKRPFAEAFGEALSELTRRERTVLRLYLVEEVSAESIGAMYRVHRATVARWIGRARKKVQSGTRRRLRDQNLLKASSFESVMGHVMDGIDLSLASFLSKTSSESDA